MEFKNEENLKEQNSSTITEPKNGLTVTKGKGTGEDGWERGITISTHSVVGVEHVKGSIYREFK